MGGEREGGGAPFFAPGELPVAGESRGGVGAHHAFHVHLALGGYCRRK